MTLRITCGFATVLALALVGLGLGPGAGVAQQMPQERVAGLVDRGDLAGARVVLDAMLAADPSDFDARIQRGNVRAWLGDYSGAREDYGSALATRPGSYAAYVGTGYAFAWEGNYPNAVGAFDAALQVQPGSEDALKGLAYVALWSGRVSEAQSRFQALSDAHPDDPEFLVGVGHAVLADRRPAEAADIFREAQALDPTGEDARLGLDAALFTPPRLGLTVWGGYTGFLADQDGESSSKSGLRMAQLAFQATSKIRIWGQYDDGMGLDNRDLVSGQTFPAVTLGGVYTWSGRALTKVEGGARSALGNRQYFGSFDQVFFLSGPLAVKVLGFVGPREDETTEWFGGGGLTVNLGRVWIEGLAVLSDTGYEKVEGGDEPRGFHLIGNLGARVGSGIEITAGGAAARLGLGGDGVNRMAEAYLKASVPIATSHRVFALLRHHRVRGPNDFTQFALGLTIAALK